MAQLKNDAQDPERTAAQTMAEFAHLFEFDPEAHAKRLAYFHDLFVHPPERDAFDDLFEWYQDCMLARHMGDTLPPRPGAEEDESTDDAEDESTDGG